METNGYIQDDVQQLQDSLGTWLDCCICSIEIKYVEMVDIFYGHLFLFISNHFSYDSHMYLISLLCVVRTRQRLLLGRVRIRSNLNGLKTPERKPDPFNKGVEKVQPKLLNI